MHLPSPLEPLIFSKLDQELNWQSRCHRLNGYITQSLAAPVFIKREDELNPNGVGAKARKYLSLLPVLEHSGIDHVILIGSAHSNNVLGLSQLLKSRGLAVSALIKTPGSRNLTGNHLLLKMLLGHFRLLYVDTADWPRVSLLAEQLARQLEDNGNRVVIIPEGAHCEEVLPGILTLAVDLQRNSERCDVVFRDIWTDSGSGVSAIGLLLGMRLLGMTGTTVHITQIAGNSDEFWHRYRQYEHWLKQLVGGPLPEQRPAVHFLRPATAAAYGSVNKTVLDQCWRIARETGLLMDPVYSVKHLYTVRCALEREPPLGPQLILYNGGTLGLSGFQSWLASRDRIG